MKLSFRKKIKRSLPWALPFLISVKILLRSIYDTLRCLGNSYFHKDSLLRKNILHIGCGNTRLPEACNVDIRATPECDLVDNCITLQSIPDASVSHVFSNAFFEHVYYDDRETCLINARRVLKQKGTIIFTGIPDFRRVAEAYLHQEKGIISKKFTIANAYRYTHGEPEGAKGWWLAQLHKSLFDVETVQSLLTQSKFSSYCIFNYSYKTDNIILTLGFIASKGKTTMPHTIQELKKKISPFNKDIDWRRTKIHISQ